MQLIIDVSPSNIMIVNIVNIILNIEYWIMQILFRNIACSSVSPSNIGIVFGSGLPIPINTANMSNWIFIMHHIVITFQYTSDCYSTIIPNIIKLNKSPASKSSFIFSIVRSSLPRNLKWKYCLMPTLSHHYWEKCNIIIAELHINNKITVPIRNQTCRVQFLPPSLS